MRRALKIRINGSVTAHHALPIFIAAMRAQYKRLRAVSGCLSGSWSFCLRGRPTFLTLDNNERHAGAPLKIDSGEKVYLYVEDLPARKHFRLHSPNRCLQLAHRDRLAPRFQMRNEQLEHSRQ